MTSTITSRTSTAGASALPDGLNGNIAWKVPCRVATTANITPSGTQTIDGVAVVADDRVLVKDQTDATENGIYKVAAGSWSRTVDLADDGDVVTGTQIRVNAGSVGAGTWYCSAADPIMIGSTDITWGQD